MSLLTLPLMGQDGGQLFGLYCSACHGADGKGAAGGQFPPLAGSPWAVGDPARAIKIVLLGLNGPVEVNGKTYNLEMPPQGAAMTDDQIAAILTHVRSSWGNKDSAVTTDQVKAVRASLGNRTEHWTAAELLKLHPLENVKPVLNHLISYYYKGSWNEMPNIKSLKPDAVEEEPKGLIDLGAYAGKDQFAMAWEGELETEMGEHEFKLDSDDGARLYVNGRLLTEIKGIGPMGRIQKKKIKLTQGIQKIRVEYFEQTGEDGISISMQRLSDKKMFWLTSLRSQAANKGWPEIMLQPKNGRAVIYRNFIQGTTARGIGVGFPEGVNLAYSADNLAPELFWKGDFIDAGHHWTDRGVGYEPPAGSDLLATTKQMVYAAQSEASNQWPEKTAVAVRFRGYRLDAKGNPTFAVDLDQASLTDAYVALAGDQPTVVRTLNLKTASNGKTAYSSLLLKQDNIQQTSATECSSGSVTMKVEGAKFRYINGAVVLDLPTGKVQVRYIWK